MTTRNFLFCLGGLVLGFGVGFLLANRLGVGSTAAPTVAASDQVSSINVKGAPPLDPSEDTGQLPPGHPDIDGVASGATPASPEGAAATSREAQAAMEAADAKPADFALQMGAAATFYKLRALDKAALYLERALKLKPQDADALLEMGNVKYDSGDFTAAADFYTRSLAANPSNADARTDLGNTFFQRNPPDYRRAIEEYRRALEIDPRHELTLQNLASAALNLKDKATARDAVDKLAAINPNNSMLAALRSSLDSLP
ncbi:MAG: tetratricopeptide repeat protein [Acidobacteria bacterium]|nr:tetratricopeptide repeat protein [Acidobacteriota bacterium]